MVKWLDILVKEAGQREKKDVKFWGAVVEIVQLCRLGIKKEAKERIMAKELYYKIGGWVEWGLGRKRRCTCEVAKDTHEQPNKRSSAEFSSKYALDQPVSGGRPSRPDWLPSSEFNSNQSTVWGLGDLATLHENMMRPASLMSSDDSKAWRLGHESHMKRDSRGPASIISAKESTVWGLGDAQRENDDDRHTIRRRNSGASVPDSCIAMGQVEVLEGYDVDDDDDDDDDEEDEKSEEEEEDEEDEYENVLFYGKEDRSDNWPLPRETLALDRGKATKLDRHGDL